VTLRYHLAALEDLSECWDYYDKTRSRTAANRVIEQIQNTCAFIQQQPGIGRRRFDIEPGLRSYPSGKYALYYRVDESQEFVAVVRILHGARDIVGMEFPSLDDTSAFADLR
jgi:toxin ParE1/3/4